MWRIHQLGRGQVATLYTYKYEAGPPGFLVNRISSASTINLIHLSATFEIAQKVHDEQRDTQSASLGFVIVVFLRNLLLCEWPLKCRSISSMKIQAASGFSLKVNQFAFSVRRSLVSKKTEDLTGLTMRISSVLHEESPCS